MTTALDVVTVGEAMVLFSATQPGALSEVQHFRRATAGAELNVAVGLSRLGFKVGYVSKVGKDSFGDHLLSFLASEGIDRSQVGIDDHHATGFMLKSLETDGVDPRIEYFRRGSAASRLSCMDNPVAYCTGSRHLHLTGICPALGPAVRELVFDMAQQARAGGRSVSFDPNLRPALWPSQHAMVECLNALASHADVVMPGLSEGRLLTGRDGEEGIADFYLERGASRVLIKLGARGAFHADAGGRGMVPGWRVPKVVDTVGAGDGFAVGVISALLQGLSTEQAARRGNAIGARVVQFPGDCDGLPTWRQLSEAMDRAGAQPSPESSLEWHASS
ncbi:sugar kinase [Piscinibacter sp. XHJ-5]|uniref:sugar kinase n=1 Tax=Piscinibacter sp. XHJ-5 TaxID=3037797 RepID=UPI00245308F6|nr:sugar kinase [Piscinibacter sp. XHJ-5]